MRWADGSAWVSGWSTTAEDFYQPVVMRYRDGVLTIDDSGFPTGPIAAHTT